jgi:adenylosuccinate lyase
LAIELEEVEQRIAGLRFRGVKGTTGTQASFLTLFDNDVQPVRLVEFAARGPLLLSFYLYDWTGT